MKHACKIITVTFIALANLAVGACLGFFFWVICVWMIDDSLADHLSDEGWRNIAIERVVISVVAAFLAGGLGALVNRYLFRLLFPENNSLPWLVAGVIGYFIAIGGIIGSVQFAIEKPFM